MAKSSAQPRRPRPARIALILAVVVALVVVVTIVVALRSRDEVDSRPGVPPATLTTTGDDFIYYSLLND